MGAESTSPCTRVKYLADLLRNKANSQQHPAFLKIRDQKVLRALKKQTVRGLLQNKKVPGTSTTAPPRPSASAGPAEGLLGESPVKCSPTCQKRLEHHRESSRRGGLCERTGPSLYGAAGLSRMIFSKRQRPSGALWRNLLQQQLQSPLRPVSRSYRGVVGMEPKPEAPGRVHILGKPETTSTGECAHS